MTYYYLAFGIPLISEIELPALFPIHNSQTWENPVHVRLGSVPDQLVDEGQNADRNAYCNANEMIYTVAEKIRFYISGGNQVIIEPIVADYHANLIYFYSNGLAAILYQRDMIPFHVSGVFTQPGKVTLFAAPSGTGKSTLAVKLQELGYQPFTDDTAILFIKDGKCYAQASYPMIRLWEQTLDQQSLLNIADKQKIFDDGDRDKFGFSFHGQFATDPVEVEKIIFIEKEGIEMKISPIKNIDAFKALSDNVYRNHWIPAMQKSRLQFSLVGQILNTVPHFMATRPNDVNSFTEFPLFIKKNLHNFNK
ncbi:hypothetical protein LWM68_35360 [Niabella sp. W65]|nr:hypothetical protein [Niabella sp. W65]MCH7367577.1 hypothetical protein [Niabella sp. W65]